MLTEEEARALSAQLDQLSKEQLEALSNDMFKQHQGAKSAGGSSQQNGDPTSTESPDYVVRLLKMLSQTSHNPEDIKLLDQLASQVNNPKPTGSDQSLIEIGQPDDLALLEALGMIPAQRQQQQQAHQSEAGTPNEPVRDHDNQPEASYNNYQETGNEMGGHQHMRPGSMRPILAPLHAQRQQQHNQQHHNNHHQQQQHHPPVTTRQPN
jgi:hypothetical protein